MDVGQKWICYKNETSIVLGQNYKIKYVDDLFMYYCKVFFEDICRETITYMRCIFHPEYQEYNKEYTYI